MIHYHGLLRYERRSVQIQNEITEQCRRFNRRHLFGGALTNQAGTDGKSRKYNLGAFWPGGHRFGAQMSSLSLYGTAAPGWRDKWDNNNIKQVSDADGLVIPMVM